MGYSTTEEIYLYDKLKKTTTNTFEDKEAMARYYYEWRKVLQKLKNAEDKWSIEITFSNGKVLKGKIIN